MAGGHHGTARDLDVGARGVGRGAAQDLDRLGADVRHALEATATQLQVMHESREERDVEQTPAYQAWERQREQDDWDVSLAIDRVTSPAYLGGKPKNAFTRSKIPQVSGTARTSITASQDRMCRRTGTVRTALMRHSATGRPGTMSTGEREFLGGQSAAVPPEELEVERAEWQEIVLEFARAARDLVEQQTQDLEHGTREPSPDEDRTALQTAFLDRQRDEIRHQIAAIQDRLDGNLPFEDWSNPGRYDGHHDDELETQLSGQLQRLQDRLEALAQPEPHQDHHREEGMSY